MQEHGVHAQLVGDPQACCPPAPPKQQSVYPRHVIAALDRDLLDGVGHVGDGES